MFGVVCDIELTTIQLPINEREVLVYEEEEAGLRKIKKIYEEHGVSSDTYDKNSCLESVKKITWWEKQ